MRVWVPRSADVSFRPLLFGVSQGYYVNLLRVRRSGHYAVVGLGADCADTFLR